MFKIDFMSSLRENKVNGFDLAIMEQINQEDEKQEVDLEELEESSEEENAEDSSDYEDSSHLD